MPTKKTVLANRSVPSKSCKSIVLNSIPVKCALNHISLADLRDASTSVDSISDGAIDPAMATNPTAEESTSRSPVYYSASDASLNAMTILNEVSSADSAIMPPPQTPFSYGKKYGNSTKLFVSGRRKTLKMRPKLHLAVPSMLSAGGDRMTASGRVKTLKRGSPLASKDSLRLKKKNKLLKVDDGTAAGGGGSGVSKRTKARLL